MPKLFSTLLLVALTAGTCPAAPPQLVRFTGTCHQSTPATVGATFSIYRQQTDGAPIWSETQNVQPDRDGGYTVLLGSTASEGIPLDLFTTNEPRWLEVEIDQVKQARILLGSVPYALKSADADTLGGLPPSAYLRANPSTTTVTNNVINGGVNAVLSPLADNGTANYLAVFTDATDLGNSVIYQTGNAVSIGGTSNLGALTLTGNVPFGDAAGMALYNAGAGSGASVSLDMYNTPFNSGIPQAKIKAIDDGDYSDNLTFWTKTPGSGSNPVVEKMRITSTGNVGIGTATPAAKLEVNGSLMVDGNVNLTGTIFSGSSGIPLFQSQMAGGNFGAGYGALESVMPNGTVGTNNTAVGSAALSTNAAGHDNTASGYQALAGNVNGNYNTAYGSGALFTNTTNGNDNTATGYQTLYHNSTASWNTATGFQALFSNTAGYANTANGYQALYNNLGSSNTGNNNTSDGYQSLFNNTSGADNTAVGSLALSNTTGSNNVALGYNAGSAVTTGSFNIMIGNSGLASDKNAIRIGTSPSQTATFIAGVRGQQTGNSDAVPVMIDSNGQLGTVNSSIRFKEDVEDMGDASRNLMRLRPVTFRYKQPFADGSKPLQYGLIAEEVAGVYPDLVAHSADGRIETVKYQVLDSLLLNELQRQQQEIARQAEEIRTLQEQLERVVAGLEGSRR